MAKLEAAFLNALGLLPSGFSRGLFEGAPWGVTVDRTTDGKRIKLHGEQLGGSDHVSFNLYVASGAPRLKPCEMPADKVIRFVLGYAPNAGGASQ